MPVELWAVSLVLIGTVIGSFGPIYFKKAAHKKIVNIWSLIKNYDLIIGVSLYSVSAIIFIPALKGGDLSILYPLVSVSYIWVALLSKWLLGEKMNITKWAGIVLIIVGITFLGFGI